MNRFAKPLLASAALCAATLLPARAEIDVISLKTAIEVLVEGDYPKLDALYKDIHAHPEIAFQLRCHREGRQNRAGRHL
jgi:hippurate hydrolase